MTEKGSEGLLDLTIKTIESRSFSYQLEEGGVVALMVRGTTSAWPCRITVDEDEDWRSVIIISQAPVAIPELRRQAVSEWILRKNYGTRIGSFQIDLDDGEVYYKTELAAADAIVTSAMLGAILDTNLYMMDSSVQGLMMIAFGGADPLSVLDDGAEIPEGSEGPLQ